MVRPLKNAELIRELQAIIAAGEYDSKDYNCHGGDGMPGSLLECLLDIPTNNSPVPDAVLWEIKTTDSKALVTLFHLSPDNRGSIRRTAENFWWPPVRKRKDSKTAKSFRCTAGIKPDGRGFPVVLDDDSVSLAFDAKKVSKDHSDWLRGVRKNCGGVLEGTPTWTWDAILRSACAKLRNVVLIETEVRQRRYVTFLRMALYRNLKLSAFERGLREGCVKMDVDASFKIDGSFHDHGTKFRIKQEDMERLYESFKPVE